MYLWIEGVTHFHFRSIQDWKSRSPKAQDSEGLKPQSPKFLFTKREALIVPQCLDQPSFCEPAREIRNIPRGWGCNKKRRNTRGCISAVMFLLPVIGGRTWSLAGVGSSTGIYYKVPLPPRLPALLVDPKKNKNKIKEEEVGVCFFSFFWGKEGRDLFGCVWWVRMSFG